jgi:hypothetical protein
MKQLFVISCIFISLYIQNVDYSDTLKFPLGTTSFKTFYEQHVGFILEEKEGEKNLTNKISKKNMVKYYFDKKEKLSGIMFALADFEEETKKLTLNNLEKKYGKGIEKSSSGVTSIKWVIGKYQITSIYMSMINFWTLMLTLKENK